MKQSALSVLVILICLVPSTVGQEMDAIVLDAINPTLPALEDPPNLETPQACVENFILASRQSDFARAALSLNFRLIEGVQEIEAAMLANRLFFVLNQELWIDWESLPDRADGMVDQKLMAGDEPLIGMGRRSIRLGSIPVDGREIPIRVQRVKTADTDPMWLFSAQTVENIDVLYETHGPGWLDGHLPDWARARGWQRVAIWKWVALAVVAISGPLMGCLVVFFVKRTLTKVLFSKQHLLSQFDWPIASIVTFGLVWGVIEFGLSLPSQVASVADPISIIAFAGSIAWLIMRTLSVIVDGVATDAVSKLHNDDSKTRRRVLMQVRVARHVLMLIVALTAVGIVMLQLGIFRAFGITVLSSVGAAAVILSIAGNAVLGNLIAGLQIALTQPFILEDAVYIEDNWGRIEDITYTYVVVRTWDDRRLVFPIKYFIEHWFENWSMTDPFLVKPIYLHVDYRADVEAIRKRFLELLEGDEHWDRENDEPEVLVTDTQDETMVVRLTCGGADPSEAWSLHCRMREKIVAWLQQHEDGDYLPRRRVTLDRRAAVELE